jgi:hypothetical protein
MFFCRVTGVDANDSALTTYALAVNPLDRLRSAFAVKGAEPLPLFHAA